MKRAASRSAGLLATAFVLAGCPRSGGTSPTDAAAEAASPTLALDETALATAEDRRRAKDVAPEVRTSHDRVARRRSARALARIADASSVDGLVAHLGDEDLETVAWAAYGLGHACKGREEAHVKLLAARAASLPTAPVSASGRGASEIDPHVAVARAIGRCGAGPLGENVLVGLLKARGPWADAALLGLGDLATRRKSLGAETMTALLDAAGSKENPTALAFYPLSRAEASETFARRLIDAAHGALARPGDARIFAIKAIGRAREAAKDAAPEVARVAADAKTFTPAERAEAARALGALGEPGQSAAAETLAKLTPDSKDGAAIAALLGSEFHVLYTLLGALGADPPKKAEPALQALAALAAPAEPKPGLARRLAELRCAAALGLARGVHDAEILRKCDVDTSEISQRARLTSLLRRPLSNERKNAFKAFAKSPHLRVREQAVEAIAQHAELGDVGAAVLAEALASKQAGLVAAAAEVVHMHPERAMVLAESEKKAALDPRAPPPTTNPAQELSKDVTKALAAALAEKWPEDRYETRIALMEAAASVHHPEAKAYASAACRDGNVTLRERASKALRALGENVAACEAAEHDIKAATEIGKTLAKPLKIVFTTDVGELAIVFEPELSPITATRITALAKSGFFDGNVIHRVVPGFVVQFGDPQGDGYGGSGTPLRCETSPVPFAAFDVGMALAGRDTGSSQIFVTLSRTPHLDGEYTRVGHASGDWAAVAQGDVVTTARVVE